MEDKPTFSKTPVNNPGLLTGYRYSGAGVLNRLARISENRVIPLDTSWNAVQDVGQFFRYRDLSRLLVLCIFWPEPDNSILQRKPLPI